MVKSSLGLILLVAIVGNVFGDVTPSEKTNEWENGVVPMEIRGDYSAEDLANINAAIDDFHKETCVKFVQRTNEKNYVTIQNNLTGCWSAVGRVGGQQKVNLEKGKCANEVGIIQHELLHVLGFVHTHDDDDDFSTLDKEHPKAIMAKLNFEKMAHIHEHDHDHDHDHKHDHDHDHDHHHHGDEHVHNHPNNHGHDHINGHNEPLIPKDIENVNKVYNCKKPTGVLPPLKVTA